MARKKANALKLQKQKRTGVDQLRLKQMNNEAHLRAMTLHSEHTIKLFKNIYGILPDDINRDFANVMRRLQGLGECSVTSSREEVIAKLNRVADRTTMVYSIGDRALYLMEAEEGYYFFYRCKGKYYKKSLVYSTRAKAMDRYDHEKITWMQSCDDVV
jgi:hypothetical protein